MTRRWIIRGFFIGILALYVGGWIASYAHAFRMDQVNTGWGRQHVWQVQIVHGRFHVFYDDGRGDDDPIWLDKRLGGFWLSLNGNFAWGWRAIQFLEVATPLWFPTLISAVLLGLVWRKTRPKPNGGAFPVEAKQTAEEKSSGLS